MEMYCISSARENSTMEVPQKTTIYKFLMALTYNGIFIITFLNAPDLECMFRGT